MRLDGECNFWPEVRYFLVSPLFRYDNIVLTFLLDSRQVHASLCICHSSLQSACQIVGNSRRTALTDSADEVHIPARLETSTCASLCICHSALQSACQTSAIPGEQPWRYTEVHSRRDICRHDAHALILPADEMDLHSPFL